MDSLHINSVAKITFSGEDNYGEEKEFDCSMHFSLILTADTTKASFSQNQEIISIKAGENDD